MWIVRCSPPRRAMDPTSDIILQVFCDKYQNISPPKIHFIPQKITKQMGRIFIYLLRNTMILVFLDQ
jgi:hypothetical protein